MRSRLMLLLLVCLAVAVQAFAQPVPTLKPGDFAAVCGDSITEQKLYSVFIEDYLLMCQPESDMRTLQVGWGGEVADSFWHRLARMCFLCIRPSPPPATA